MRNKLKLFWRDESGASAAEYALILALVGIGIAIGAEALGNAVTDAMNDAEDCITSSDPSGGCGD